jgi:hypothetical protein
MIISKEIKTYVVQLVYKNYVIADYSYSYGMGINCLDYFANYISAIIKYKKDSQICFYKHNKETGNHESICMIPMNIVSDELMSLIDDMEDTEDKKQIFKIVDYFLEN